MKLKSAAQKPPSESVKALKRLPVSTWKAVPAQRSLTRWIHVGRFQVLEEEHIFWTSWTTFQCWS